jgi:hypothetical protein
MIRRPWAEADVSPASFHDVNRAVPIVFKWTVTHPCAPALTATEISLGGIPEGWNMGFNLSDDNQNASKTIRATLAFADKKAEPYEVQLLVNEGTGQSVPLGKAVSVRVDWSLPDYVKYYGAWVGAIFGVVHTAVFVLLIVGARWSGFSWQVLTDPVWGKIGLWFYFGLRHASPLQRWVMARFGGRGGALSTIARSLARRR